MRVIYAKRWPDDARGELAPLRGASLNGRQIFTLAQEWPELDEPKITGLYQALGREKMLAYEEVFGGFDDRGFDIKPAAVVLQFMSWGLTTALAIARKCRGPLWVLEGDELAGVMATERALVDLERGRCDQALVASAVHAEVAWLTLLGKGDGLRWRTAYGDAQSSSREDVAKALSASLEVDVSVSIPEKNDPHAMGAIQRAQLGTERGQAAMVWTQTPDERFAAIAFAPVRS